MAGNNNHDFARAYANSQLPQYQTPVYSPYGGMPQQMPVYSNTPQYHIPNDQTGPPMQAYGYQPPPPPPHTQPMQYSQQYQQQYQPQHQHQYQHHPQFRMNQMPMQLNPETAPMIGSLPNYQLDGPPSMPRPAKTSAPRAPGVQAPHVPETSLSHPVSYNPESVADNARRQQHKQQQQQSHMQSPMLPPGPAPPRPQSITPQQSSSTVRQQSSGRPSSASSKPATPTPRAAPTSPAASTSVRPQQADLPVDYQVLLLALADEYISKAHGMSAVLVRNMREEDVEVYHKLMASGLGCLESILRNFKFPDPRIEARLVHKYCSLLLEETHNDDTAHEILSKTVKTCERYKLTDLRYSLIHLQLRFHFRSRPSAALKMLDQLLLNIEAYRHTSWNYAMRFLRVTLSLQMSQPDVSAALQQLRRIAAIAQGNHHVPILVTSAALEALVHLKSDSHEAVQLAQRALATARMHQLDESLQGIPQLAALLDCLALCCDLINLAPDQAIVKMTQMQKIMDAASSNKTWRSDGSYSVPVGEPAEKDVNADTGGVFERTASGQRALVFKWIRKSELFSLGYLFSGISTAHKNGLDRKAARYLEEGAKINEKFNPADEQGPQSLNVAQAQCERRAFLHRTMLLHLVLIRCNRSEWASANSLLEPISQSLSPSSRQGSNSALDILTIYLEGLTKQGQGDITGALARYQSPVLSLTSTASSNQPPPTSAGGMIQEVRMLSALNTVLIVRNDPSQTPYIQTLLRRLELACRAHPDRSFAAAYNLVRVSSTPNLPITTTKDLLSKAMSTAKSVSNSHLVCMTMNLMNATFFRDIVGEQAEKSARVGQTLARRCANPLWIAVASGMLAGTLEVCGAREESGKVREEGVRALAGLEKGVWGNFRMSI